MTDNMRSLDNCKTPEEYDSQSWCRAVAVAVSTSEHLPGTYSDHACAAQGLTLVKLRLIKLTLQEVIVELVSLTLGPEGRLYQTNWQPSGAKRKKSSSVGVLGVDPP